MIQDPTATGEARWEPDGADPKPLTVVQTPGSDADGAFDLSPESEKEMVILFKNIENLMEGLSGKVIQFIGAHEKAGTSTVARSFAAAAAFRFGKKTILVDAAFDKPKGQDASALAGETGPVNPVKNLPPEKLLKRVGNTCLFLCTIPAPGSDPCREIQHSAAVRLWELLKNRFEVIVVDSAPASGSAEGVSLARTADGVVFVVEAEKTRRPVARNGLDAIRKAGGNVLGVAFNKRRYYIPESIYRKL